jgi:hypothetical protein
MSYKIQLAKGRKVEREHLPYLRVLKKKNKCPTEKQFVEGIAKAHIKEFPKGNYYDELAKMEKKLRKNERKK